MTKEIKSMDINEHDSLHSVVQRGILDVVKYHIDEENADFTLKDSDGFTPLHIAAANGYLDIVEYLIDDKKADFTVKSNCGNTTLHWAICCGHLNVIKYLIDEKNADFNVKYENGCVSLIYAAGRGHLDIIKYFIAKKAGFNIKTHEGKTVLDIAIENNNIIMNNYKLLDAAKEGNLDTVKECIDNGADPNTKDDYGKTPLHFAAKHGHLDTVKYLIDEKNADFNVKEFAFRYTPLHLSTYNGKLDVAKYLVEKGADDKGIVWCNMKAPVPSFTGRDNELKALHDKLQSKTTAIIGLGGIGKSELARKYVYDYEEDYSSNIVWINAETQESLEKSFQKLAEELKIPLEEKRDGKVEERDIKSVVNDIYNYFRIIKGLFIFDNAWEYKDIKEFLPSSFSSSPDDKEPDVLITSCNQKWENIELLPLDAFTDEEAMAFIKKFLKIENDIQDKDIKELARKLQYYPLALRQAVPYIKDRNATARLIKGYKKSDFSDYLEEYEKTTEPNEGDCYTKTIYKTLEVAIETIKCEGYGQKALDILEIMAYLAPYSVPERFFLNPEWDVICLLKQYSVINARAGQDVVNIYRPVQQAMRLKLQKQGKEKEVLSKSLDLLEKAVEDETLDVNSHFECLLNYASKYRELDKKCEKIKSLIDSSRQNVS